MKLKQQDFTDISVSEVYKEKMTYEEALKTCKMALKAIGMSHSPQSDYKSVAEVIKEMSKEKDVQTLIKCVEKQIPKKPYTDNENGIYEQECCPTCNRHLFPNEHHCRCGQAIDWSDKTKQLTDEDIIKGVCKRPLCKPAQEIIARQKAELEELKKQNEELHKFIEKIG